MKKLAAVLGIVFIISSFGVFAAFGAEKNAGAQSRIDNFRNVKFTSDDRESSPSAKPKDRTLLMLAVQKKQNGVAKLLIEKGADVNAIDSNGQTALLIAVASGNDKIVRLLLDMGANPNVTDNKGRTPLLIAMQKNKPGIARLLIERGADTNVQY